MALSKICWLSHLPPPCRHYHGMYFSHHSPHGSYAWVQWKKGLKLARKIKPKGGRRIRSICQKLCMNGAQWYIAFASWANNACFFGWKLCLNHSERLVTGAVSTKQLRWSAGWFRPVFSLDRWSLLACHFSANAPAVFVSTEHICLCILYTILKHK